MRYCVRCGAEESPNTPLVGSLCLKCFLEHRGIFRRVPILTINTCSKCGSIRISGRWLSGLGISDALARIVESTYRKFADPLVVGLEVVSVRSIHRATKRHYEAILDVKAWLKGSNNKLVAVDSTVTARFSIAKTICPRCMRKAGKSYGAIVQVRSERGRLTDDEVDFVYDIIADQSIASDIVEINENRNGIDIRVISPIIAKRIASIISREKGAKVVETFKVKKYDPTTGTKKGIVTLSVRIPDIVVGDIMLCDGEPCVVTKYDGSGITVTKVNGGQARFSINDYWRGAIQKPRDLVDEGIFTVAGYDSTSLYLVKNDTGEFIEYPRSASLYNLKQGDKIRGFRVGGRLYMIKYEG